MASIIIASQILTWTDLATILALAVKEQTKALFS